MNCELRLLRRNTNTSQRHSSMDRRNKTIRSNKEVKSSYDWITAAIILHNGLQLQSPSFSSGHDDGELEGRKLDWNIGVSSNIEQQGYYRIGSPATLQLGLFLLTKNLEEDICVSYSFSITDYNISGRGAQLFRDSGNYKFNKGGDKLDKVSWSKMFTLTLSGSWKITCELSYLESIFEIDAASELSESLGRLLLDPKLFSDVTLKSKGTEFKVHKNILSVRSPVFAAMFQHDNTKENLENVVEIRDMEPDTVQEMVGFIYTGTAPNLDKMAPELLEAGDRYELNTLMAMAEKRLISTISLDNAIELLVLADTHSEAAALYSKAVAFIAGNVEALKKREEWKRMIGNQPHLLDAILSEVVKRLH